jgi:hypothetical protein
MMLSGIALLMIGVFLAYIELTGWFGYGPTEGPEEKVGIWLLARAR